MISVTSLTVSPVSAPTNAVSVTLDTLRAVHLALHAPVLIAPTAPQLPFAPAARTDTC